MMGPEERESHSSIAGCIVLSIVPSGCPRNSSVLPRRWRLAFVEATPGSDHPIRSPDVVWFRGAALPG
jgi:hypothetical protein